MVDDWNRKHALNTAVTVENDRGEIIHANTTSEAWLLGGHTAVIQVTKIAGAYSLDRVKAQN